MSDISHAIKQLCEEKNLDQESVVSAIETALAAAYRKDYGERNQNIRVKFDVNTGESKIFDVKTVVDDLPEEEEAEMLKNLYNPESRDTKKESAKEKEAPVKEKEANKEGEEDEEEVKRFNPKTDIQIKEAVILKHDAAVGDEIITDLPIPESYGRMAAQTAKQVIIQKLREMERDMVFNEFKGKENEVVGGIVQRREGRFVFVDIGKAIGLLPAEEQIYSERYNPGERIKIFIKEVREGHKGPEIILSRRSDEILKKIFYLEIPEIANNLVEIKAVAREAGSRSKVAIYTEAENVDPVGSCVGQRGSRIQTIINELGGEKIDIIEYNEDPAKFIANALAPAQVISIELDEKEQKATVKVSSDKLSLAIGKNGQNVRLAARLTGWKIDIIEATEDGKVVKVASVEDDEAKPEDVEDDKKEDKTKKDDKKEDVAKEKKEDKKEVEEKKEKKTTKKKEDKETKKITEKKATKKKTTKK